MIIETTSYRCDRCNTEVATNSEEAGRHSDKVHKALAPAGLAPLIAADGAAYRALVMLGNVGRLNLMFCVSCARDYVEFMEAKL